MDYFACAKFKGATFSQKTGQCMFQPTGCPTGSRFDAASGMCLAAPMVDFAKLQGKSFTTTDLRVSVRFTSPSTATYTMGGTRTGTINISTSQTTTSTGDVVVTGTAGTTTVRMTFLTNINTLLTKTPLVKFTFGNMTYDLYSTTPSPQPSPTQPQPQPPITPPASSPRPQSIDVSRLGRMMFSNSEFRVEFSENGTAFVLYKTSNPMQGESYTITSVQGVMIMTDNSAVYMTVDENYTMIQLSYMGRSLMLNRPTTPGPTTPGPTTPGPTTPGPMPSGGTVITPFSNTMNTTTGTMSGMGLMQ